MMNPPPEKNKEGLTFEEWHTATIEAAFAPSRTATTSAEYVPTDLAPEERASLIALMATRTKLNSVRSQIYTKREELEVLEKQRNELTVELATHLRELVSGFTPYTPQSEEY